MEDIKTLYLAAKTSGNQKDVDSYAQCIRESMENNPINYVTNLEYIISSSIGAPTFKKFVENYGISVAWYDDIMTCLENCIEKCQKSEKDDSIYKEYVARMESFKQEYKHCFSMFESFRDDLSGKNYLPTYYGFNKGGIQNKKLICGMMDRFKEASIPDAIITANSLGESAVNTILQALNNTPSSDQNVYQWIVESCKDITSANGSLISSIREKSPQTIVESMKAKYDKVFCESVILGDDDVVIEYTEQEVEAVRDLISFKEHLVTCMESSDEIMSTQKEIYSLYEKFSALIEFDEVVADSVIPMLPGANTKHVNPVEESKWITNTGNKKTGETPDYIKRNHNVGYGETDSDNHGGRPSDDAELSMDDYKRPSANVPNEDITSLLEPDTSKDTSFPDEVPKEHADGKPLTNEEKQAINNYYYYTYTNSLNKNTNSLNRHSSQSDDHSANKRIHSDNNNNPTMNESYYMGTKSMLPWELNIELLNEDAGDADDMRPQSDHPVKDVLTDIDRGIVKKQQEVKKGVQNTVNAGKAFVKPVQRNIQWVGNMISQWKDADETKIKEKMADPKTRSGLFGAIRFAVKYGSLAKAGLLFNPIFLFLSVTKRAGKNKREFRLRNEMIGEIKTEIEIIEEKIKDADRLGDNKAKYQLMRFKNELSKKLIRVGGNKKIAKMI